MKLALFLLVPGMLYSQEQGTTNVPSTADIPRPAILQPCAEKDKLTYSTDNPHCWLEAKLKLWQKRLDLGEWKVTVEPVGLERLKPDTLGNLKYNTDEKSAHIKVLRPDYYVLSQSDVWEDMEYTILHELLHLQLSVLPHDGSSKLAEEGVLKKIGYAMFELDRHENYVAKMRGGIKHMTKEIKVPSAEEARTSK